MTKQSIKKSFLSFGNAHKNNLSNNGMFLFSFASLAKHQEIIHFITNRKGGYSKKPFNELNLAFHVGDDFDNVLKNRTSLADYLNIPLNNFTTANQVHGTNITIVDDKMKGLGSKDLTSAIPGTDALLTDQLNVCLLIFVADCVPIIVYDIKKKVIGLIHAGWKGTAGLITEKVIKTMKSHWNCEPKNILCGIGPSIGSCCYEVGAEVRDKIKEVYDESDTMVFTNSTNKDKVYFDLWKANKIQLLKCQIPADNIEIAEICTYCDSNLFFSSRKDHGVTGRFAAGIMLKNIK